ncbi:MAG: sensor histidine kinase [Caldisericaceae bacterium]
MRLNDIEKRVKRQKLRLAITYTLITILISALLMASFFVVYSNSVYKNFDTSIMQRAASIASTLSGREELSSELLNSLKLSQSTLQSGNEIIEITDNKGNVAFLSSAINSPKIKIEPDKFSFGTYLEQVDNKEILQKIRAYTASVQNQPYYVTVGMTYEDISNSINNILLSFLLILPFILIITLLASYKLASTAINPIEQSYRDLRQFTEDASHELKTPIAAIKANIDVALSKDVKEIQYYREKLDVINNSVNRMASIITNMLHLSDMDSGSYEFRKEKVDLNLLINDVKKRFTDSALQKNISLDSESTNAFVETNREALEEILGIIVENAIKFNKYGGNVKIYVDSKYKGVRINIKDTGIGIAREDLPHIFDRFYRGEKSRSRETGGAGLGLSIAYNLAQKIGAHIEVRSEESVGSTFTIIID